MMVVTRTSVFTRGFVSVTKSAHAREPEVATAFVLTLLTAFSSYSLFPVSCLLDLAARLAHLAEHPVFHPLLVPPFDGVHGIAVDQHREVQVIAAGQARHARAPDR